MTMLAALVGWMMAAMGGTLAAKPEMFRQIVPRLVTPKGLLWISALRLALGAILLLAAARTRLPLLLYIVGGLSLASGFTTPFIGVDRARKFVGWWITQPDLILRLWAAVAVSTGLAVVWAAN